VEEEHPLGNTVLVPVAELRSNPKIVKRLITAWIIGVAAVATPLCIAAQGAPPRESSPAQIVDSALAINEAVITTEWPHTLDLVNAPPRISLITPGECIRIGVYAIGDGRDEWVRHTQISFTVLFAGQTSSVPLTPLSQFKKIKPEGGDFVTTALGAANVANPMAQMTNATLGTPSTHWCAPNNSPDGIAAIQVSIKDPSGLRPLTPVSVDVQSFSTGVKKVFANDTQFSSAMASYYKAPNATRLLPMLQYVTANKLNSQDSGILEDFGAFLSAALKADPIAAADLAARLPNETPMTCAIGYLAMKSAGYDTEALLSKLPIELQQGLKAMSPLADPYDMSATRALFNHLDMMWSAFGATGQYAPVKAVVTALAWHTDYIELQNYKNSPNHPTELPPAIIRGAAYSAAGWSLNSFRLSDPIVADYIDYMLSSPDIAPQIKTELSGLSSNPAFQRNDSK
jgi:hypothetical protein